MIITRITQKQKDALEALKSYASLEEAPQYLLHLAAFGVTNGRQKISVSSLCLSDRCPYTNISINDVVRIFENTAKIVNDGLVFEPMTVVLKDRHYYIMDNWVSYAAAVGLQIPNIEINLSIQSDPIEMINAISDNPTIIDDIDFPS